MTEQLHLNLNDDLLYADACYHLIKKERCRGSTHPHLFPSSKHEDKMWLGTRTGGYETEYDRYYQINKDAAVSLLQKYKDIGCSNREFLEYASSYTTDSE